MPKPGGTGGYCGRRSSSEGSSPPSSSSSLSLMLWLPLSLMLRLLLSLMPWLPLSSSSVLASSSPSMTYSPPPSSFIRGPRSNLDSRRGGGGLSPPPPPSVSWGGGFASKSSSSAPSLMRREMATSLNPSSSSSSTLLSIFWRRDVFVGASSEKGTPLGMMKLRELATPLLLLCSKVIAGSRGSWRENSGFSLFFGHAPPPKVEGIQGAGPQSAFGGLDPQYRRPPFAPASPPRRLPSPH